VAGGEEFVDGGLDFLRRGGALLIADAPANLVY
jgi:hypothetical protein